ncbi:MAG: DUF4286 family protein [Microscillaceae bacterium]|jgi:histidinol-phosphate/aromatic aminotransferase/cobyric acid decarboxylase-like protein|nr:DUF4286 family protein [Microscillaceae bacterium]
MSPQIIYNVTSHVEHSIEAEWLEWMKKEHIPEVMQTGLFLEYKILKLISEENEGGTSYAIQYLVPEIKNFLQYSETFAPALRQKVLDKYGEKVIAFRTLLEVID